MLTQFEKVKGNFGFGCMRLPMKDGEVDTEEFSRMVDAFLEAGFNYFDTAHGYLDGKSEPALRESLTSPGALRAHRQALLPLLQQSGGNPAPVPETAGGLRGGVFRLLPDARPE